MTTSGLCILQIKAQSMRTTAGQLIAEFGSGRPLSYHAIQEEALCCKEDVFYV